MRVLTIVAAAGLIPAVAFMSLFGVSVASAQGGADVVYQVQQLQEEIRQLRGMVEQQGQELERLRQRQRDQYLDLDARLQNAQVAAPAANNTAAVTPNTAPATVPPLPNTTPATSPSAADLGVPEVRQPTTVESTVTAIAEPVVESRQPSATVGEDEQSSYDRAFAELKALRYDRAADGFRAFLQRHPNSRLADNAQYWLGESYYGGRNFTMALDAFRQLLEVYPDSSKRADAMLKVGYSHYELRQWPDARAALEQVQSQFPDTTIARLAENRLRTMRLEGRY
ncbi:MAG: tol-pal system protein YbgF [Wenzhouxiangellaceae bacterium]